MNTLRVFQAPQPGRQTISEGIEDFFSYLTIERNCPDTTIRAYRNDLEQLAEFLGYKPASTVTIADLRAWLESMDHAPSTIGRKLATARSYFRFGIREGWANTNPARELDMPRHDKILPRILTEEQVTTILHCVESKRDRAILEVLYAGINPHAFRHSYATHLIDHGANVRDVQELLGHRSITSTQIYTHVSPVRKQAVYNKCHPRA